MKTKTKTLVTAAILLCSFALASSSVRADSDDYYQGRRGHWMQQQNAWRFQDVDGNIYRQHGHSWQWYNGRHHGEVGTEYHNRAPGDNRTYNQFRNDERH